MKPESPIHPKNKGYNTSEQIKHEKTKTAADVVQKDAWWGWRLAAPEGEKSNIPLYVVQKHNIKSLKIKTAADVVQKNVFERALWMTLA